MQSYPGLLSESFSPYPVYCSYHVLFRTFVLCAGLHQSPKRTSWLTPLAWLSRSQRRLVSVAHVFTLSVTSKVTAVSPYAPDEYEKHVYYNGITNDHPVLVYRSDYQSTLFPKPSGRHAPVPVRALRGVFDTPLNKAWPAVGPQMEAETQQLVGDPLVPHVSTANATHRVRRFLTVLLGVPLTTEDWEKKDG